MLNFLKIIIIGFVLVFSLNACNTERDVSLNSKDEPVVIGVYGVEQNSEELKIFKSDIEKNLGILIDFYELTPENNRDTYDKVEYINKLLVEEKIDMILNIPSTSVLLLLENYSNNLMELSESINNINNIQKSALDNAKKIGNGDIYYLPTTIDNWYCLFENVDLLNDLDILPLNDYITWDDFIDRLENIENAIISNEITDINPLAMLVQNEGESFSIAEGDFLMYGYGLDAPLVYNDILIGHEKWENFLKNYSIMVDKYGVDTSMIDQRYVFNFFSLGKHVVSTGDLYLLEQYTAGNEMYNEQSPFKVTIDFEMNIVPMPVYTGDEGMINARYSGLAINKYTKNIDNTLSIVNYMFNKKFTMKMIQSRYKNNIFSTSDWFFPTYFDDDIIKELNLVYDGLFDVHNIYDATKGSVSYPIYNQTDKTQIYKIFSIAFGKIFNNGNNENYYEPETFLLEHDSYTDTHYIDTIIEEVMIPYTDIFELYKEEIIEIEKMLSN